MGKYGQYGNGWKSQLGMGGSFGTPGGGWAGSLFSDGARIFVSPMGVPLGRESGELPMPAGAVGGNMGTAMGYAGRGPWGFVPFGQPWGSSAIPAEEIATSSSAAVASPWANTIQELAPTISTIVEATQNPIRKYEVLKARLENARRAGASQAQLNILQAKVDAAAVSAGLKQESAMATRQWRAYGQTAVVVGIGLGLALTFAVLSKSLK